MLLIKQDLKMIYSKKRVYVLLLSYMIFILYLFKFHEVSTIEEWCNIYGINILLWIITIPVIISINKCFIYSVSYSNLARFGSKKNYLFYSYLTIFLSTFVICIFMLIIPLVILVMCNMIKLEHNSNLYIAFYWSRYFWTSLFAQYIIKVLILLIPKLQRNETFIYLLPVILYVVLTVPNEYLGDKSVIQLEFGTGAWILSNLGVSIKSLYIGNISIICYVFILAYLSMQILSKYMEYEQND